MSKNKPDVVAGICNTSYMVGIGRRIMVQSQFSRKDETLLKKQTKTKRNGSVT
jgi:hypothetical protein